MGESFFNKSKYSHSVINLLIILWAISRLVTDVSFVGNGIDIASFFGTVDWGSLALFIASTLIVTRLAYELTIDRAPQTISLYVLSTTNFSFYL